MAATAAAEPPPPPGANPTSCHPNAQHPYPVILVHGTFENRFDNWGELSPELASLGYCVYALDYGANQYTAGTFYGLAHVAASADQLATYVQQVLAATRANKVDIVGHSQGGMMPRYYINFDGGDSKVNTLVGLAPSNHGTTLNGLFILASYFPGASDLVLSDCPACREQEAGSSFITHLNAIGETRPDVNYTVIESDNDEVVTPYTSAFLSGPAVTNIDLQQQCPLDGSEHLATPFDHVALRDVLNALDPKKAAAPECGLVLPIIGG